MLHYLSPANLCLNTVAPHVRLRCKKLKTVAVEEINMEWKWIQCLVKAPDQLEPALLRSTSLFYFISCTFTELSTQTSSRETRDSGLELLVIISPIKRFDRK